MAGSYAYGRRTDVLPKLTAERVVELTGFTDPRVVQDVIEDADRISDATGVGVDDVARVLGQLGGWDLPPCTAETGR